MNISKSGDKFLSNSLLRIGIIGCGSVVLTRHIPALLTIDTAHVIGVADPAAPNREKARFALKLPNKAAYADFQSLLKAGVDYVLVAVPPKFRRPIIEDCARMGIHVITEKPLAIVPEEGRAMIEMMQAAGLHFGIMHNYLFMPHFMLAHQLIQQGVIGKLRHMSLQWMNMRINPGNDHYNRHWRHDFQESGGGILLDILHAVYLAVHFMGGPVRAVSATIDNFDRDGEQVEGFGIVHYHFDEGYTSTNLWWGCGPNGFEMSGTEGYLIQFDNSPSTSTLSHLTLINRQGEQVFPLEGDDFSKHTAPFAAIHADFARAIQEDRPPIAPAQAGLTALEAILAAYASAATGRVVSLPLSPDDPVFQQGAIGIRELPIWPDSPAYKRGLFAL